MKKIAVFASGTGSNFQAIQEAILRNEINAEISLLVSDRPKSKVLLKAEKYNIECFSFKSKEYKSKDDYELEILEKLHEAKVDLIVLAGYMRLIGNVLLEKFPKRIINIHPSLLPSFKGIDAIGQAINSKVIVTGVTVHFVDAGMDTGEIIEQKSLYIGYMKTREEIETEIHKIEHKLYPIVINKLLEEI